jgi:hypothetical protein
VTLDDELSGQLDGKKEILDDFIKRLLASTDSELGGKV